MPTWLNYSANSTLLAMVKTSNQKQESQGCRCKLQNLCNAYSSMTSISTKEPYSGHGAIKQTSRYVLVIFHESVLVVMTKTDSQWQECKVLQTEQQYRMQLLQARYVSQYIVHSFFTTTIINCAKSLQPVKTQLYIWMQRKWKFTWKQYTLVTLRIKHINK